MDSPSDTGDLELRRRRLLFRSWHRGTREMDLITGRFANHCLSSLSTADLDDYERVLLISDADLMDYIITDIEVPPEYDCPVLRHLRDFSRSGSGVSDTR